MHIQTATVDRQRQTKKNVDTDRQTWTERQKTDCLLQVFCILQPQTVCENKDCLQAWLEQVDQLNLSGALLVRLGI